MFEAQAQTQVAQLCESIAWTSHHLVALDSPSYARCFLQKGPKLDRKLLRHPFLSFVGTNVSWPPGKMDLCKCLDNISEASLTTRAISSARAGKNSRAPPEFNKDTLYLLWLIMARFREILIEGVIGSRALITHDVDQRQEPEQVELWTLQRFDNNWHGGIKFIPISLAQMGTALRTEVWQLDRSMGVGSGTYPELATMRQ